MLRGLLERLLSIWRGLLLAALGGVILLAPLPIEAHASTERVLRVEASSYFYSPAVLRVNPGDRVTIELVSKDVVHGIYLDGYGISLEADPGQTERLTFIADRAGSFRFRCSVTCGALHPFMIGKLNVGANLLLWRAAGLAILAAIWALWVIGK